MYPEELVLKAGVIETTSFGGFMFDLLDRLVDIALEDNVTLTVEKEKIQELYGPNLALISTDCNPGETTEVEGVSYSCDDFDFIIGDYWPNPERYTLVDFTPPWLTTSVSTIKYTEKKKNPHLDVTTLTEATRTGAPVCCLESSYTEWVVTSAFPDITIAHCSGSSDDADGCLTMLRNEECQLIASDELYLRSLQTTHPYFEVTGEHLVRQLLAWPKRKSLDPTSSFLLNKWVYAAISNQVIDELYFEYFEKKLCPIGTAGADCELPCDPDHGSSNAQGQCVCESIRWTGDDCSVEVALELNLIPSAIKVIAYSMVGLNTVLVLVGGIWLRLYWDRPEVKYSQPGFLALVLVGCLVSTSTILAMVQEDEGDGPVDVCVAVPWLYSLGFSITFGTLFAKIRRVYGIFAQGHRSAAIRDSNRRARTSFQETLSTIGAVLVFDVVILVLWTAADPLYWRRDIIRQDQFGFVLESQGYCTSEDWALFLGILITLHVFLCAIACYMCYVSRNIPSRYSEHKYLTIAMVSNLQVFAIGVPVLVIVENDPAAHIFVRSAVVWMNDFVVLVLIFGNLMYGVHSSKSVGQMTGRDKRKVSQAVRSFEPAASSNFNRSERSDKKKSVSRGLNTELDLENGSAFHGPGGTQGTSGSLAPKKESQIVFSELSMSGFEGLGHEASIASNAKSKAESAARWVSSPGPSSHEKGEQSSLFGPAIPTREESVFDQSEESSEPLPSKLQMSNSGDVDENGCVEAEGEKSQKKAVRSILEFADGAEQRLSSERLSSIAELEWSDEEDNLTNQTPPAMMESRPQEKPPVMPRRFEAEAWEE